MAQPLTAAAGLGDATALFAGPAARFHAHPPFPVMGVAMLLVLLLLGLVAYLLISRAKGRRPLWAAAPEPPEYAARRVLAERFARGDITVDEFLERASVLNWTPGSREGGRK
ncbi:SHOCT domain-containing protein [Streptomonospora wellingtoniae]|uniref:SHOCT domain-containing protein n=1 Tax=Streptomonospora wellingtoniae TaxID=3075544 RepID=A0ABU2KSI1_9ACTN|nr:SHOCT domain-containing protein [Streptomonospora sp. DSM 45055]MDT0302208.1 SHOCT domain-containing protein [Streptomonospora sp. DSM 45055]